MANVIITLELVDAIMLHTFVDQMVEFMPKDAPFDFVRTNMIRRIAKSIDDQVTDKMPYAQIGKAYKQLQEYFIDQNIDEDEEG